MKFDKLVRDRIPEIIVENNGIPVTHTASGEEYRKRLLAKLKEETEEFTASPCEEELADILEVVGALCDHFGFSPEAVEALRRKKARERGGFSGGVVLEETL